MNDGGVVRPMTRLAAPALLAALLLLPLALPFAQAAPTSFTINIVSATSHGCSPDVLTPPDLRVRVLVNGAPVYTTPKADQQHEPVFAITVPASTTLPVTIGIEAEEAEPAGFFGTGTSYLTCTVGPGGATRAEFTYGGEPVLTRVLRGDDSRAAAVYVVVGTSPPPAPAVTAEPGDTSITLSWGADPTGQATGHRVARGGVGGVVLDAVVAGNAATVSGLCDNRAYTFRVIRDTTTWHVTSADVTATTRNVAPQAPAVLAATRDGNVSFDSPTTHDVARYEVHASSASSFTPSDATLRKSFAPSFLTSREVQTTDVAFTASDAYALVRVVDTGGLHADSAPYGIGAPRRSSPYGPAEGCAFAGAAPTSPTSGGSTSGGSTSGGSSSGSSSPAPEPDEETPASGETNGTDGAATPCCFDFAWSFDAGAGERPHVASGGKVGLRLHNIGTRSLTFELSIADRSGAGLRFLPVAERITLAPGAASRTEVAVRAVSTLGTYGAFDAAVRIAAVEADLAQEARIVVEIPDPSQAFATNRSDLLVVDAPDVTHLVPVGGTVEVEVFVTSRSATELTVEFVQLPAQEASGPARLNLVYGFEARPDRALLRLAPYGQQTMTVTLAAPATVAEGRVVVVPLTFRTTSGASIQDVPVTFNVQTVAPVETLVTGGAEGPRLGGATLAAMGAVGAAGAGAGLALWARRDASRYLLAVALYTRLARSETLAHPKREELRRLIEQEPGICYSVLKEETGMNTGALVHHLRTLERGGFVTSRREGAFRRFYAVGATPSLATLVRVDPGLTPAQARVVDLLRESPLTQGELAQRLGLSQQGTSHHVKALERAGHIEARFDGRAWRYHVIERVDVPR